MPSNNRLITFPKKAKSLLGFKPGLLGQNAVALPLALDTFLLWPTKASQLKIACFHSKIILSALAQNWVKDLLEKELNAEGMKPKTFLSLGDLTNI